MELQLSYSVFGLILHGLWNKSNWISSFQTVQTDSVKISALLIFNSTFHSNVELNLSSGQKSNLQFKVRATTLLIGVWFKTDPILIYELLNFWGFWKNSEIQLSLNWAEVQVCFSSISTTELKNLPKSKLEGFKSSKTFLKGPEAYSLWILKYKPDNLKGSLEHLEISEVQGLNQIFFGLLHVSSCIKTLISVKH